MKCKPNSLERGNDDYVIFYNITTKARGFIVIVTKSIFRYEIYENNIHIIDISIWMFE